MEVQLIGDHLLLRPLRDDDVSGLYEAVLESMAEVSPWLSWCHQDYSINESRQFISSRAEAADSDEWYSFGIFATDTGAFLGGVGLNFINRVHQMGNLGYWVRTAAAGRGIATQAARLMARFAFEQVGLHRVEIVVAISNIASQRVAEKTGAVREGVLRNRLLIRGVTHNAILFSLIPSDLS
jgi:ribosomal-protein-serine acetyltransferase